MLSQSPGDRTERFVDTLTRRKKLVLATSLVVTLLGIAGLFRLEVNTDFGVFMPTLSDAQTAMADAARSFGDDAQLLVLADPFETDKGAEPIQPDSVVIADRLRLIDGVRSVMDGEVYRLLLKTGASFPDVISGVEAVFQDAGFDATISGEPYLESEFFRYMLLIMTVIPPGALVLVLLVFRLRIGSMSATVLAMVPAGFGALVTLGAIGWTRNAVSVVTAIVPIFVIVLGSADGLHITSHVRDAMSTGMDKRSAVITTLRAVGLPVVLTTVTTMVGFLSLLVINSPAIRALGMAAAGGVALAGFATWFILPAVLLHLKPLQTSGASRQRPDRITNALSRLRGWPSIVLAVSLVAVFLPGALQLQANMSIVDILRPRTEVRRDFEKTASALGGAIPIYVVFDAGTDLDPVVARAVLELEDVALDTGLAGRTISAYSALRSAWESASGATGYPESVAIVKALFSRIAKTNPGASESFFSPDGTGRAAFFLKNIDNQTLSQFISLTNQIELKTGVKLTPVGNAFVIKEMNDQIIPQLFMSLCVAAVLVFLLTAFTQRALLLGIAAIMPIVITLVCLFGVMGYGRIDLNIITGMMSGLTVGVGIDYSIHYVSLLKQARRRGDRFPSDSALSYVATPVLANAIGLAVGFSALLFSPIQTHTTLSILMWVTMITSAVLSLTLLPTITRRPIEKPA